MTDFESSNYFNKPDNYFNNSRIKDYLTCPAFFLFRWILKIEIRQKNINLEFGTACHEALAHYFSLFFSPQLSEKRMIESEKRIRLSEANNILSSILIGLPEHKTKTASLGEKLVKLTIDLINNDKVFEGSIAGVESEYVKKLTNEIYYFGKIDLEILQAKTHKKMIVDYKTKGRLSSFYFDWLTLSRQLMGYLFLTDSNLMSIIVLHCITKPEVKYGYYHKKEEEIRRWKEQTISLTSEIYDKIVKVRNAQEGNSKHIPFYNLFPKSAVKCENYYCEYQRLCEQNCACCDVIVDSMYYTNEIEEEESMSEESISEEDFDSIFE